MCTRCLVKMMEDIQKHDHAPFRVEVHFTGDGAEFHGFHVDEDGNETPGAPPTIFPVMAAFVLNTVLEEACDNNMELFAHLLPGIVRLATKDQLAEMTDAIAGNIGMTPKELNDKIDAVSGGGDDDDAASPFGGLPWPNGLGVADA